MTESDRVVQKRDRHLRRTTSARRGVVAAGTVSALGAAVAIGVHQRPTTAAGANDSGGGLAQRSGVGRGTPPVSGLDDAGEGSDDGGRQPVLRSQQPPPGGGQLATPGNGGPAQGNTSGS